MSYIFILSLSLHDALPISNSMFGTFSGGEKAMAMYVPLFSAVVAKYEGGRADAPRLISLDEAFAGVDNRNIRDMFRSEEHTSELQSRFDLVCRLLLEKKKS